MLSDDNSTKVELMASDGELLSGNLVTAVDGVAAFSLIPDNYGTFTLHGVAYGGITSPESNPVTIAKAATPSLDSLEAGTLVNFAGYNWILLDPAAGYLLMQDNLRSYADGAGNPLPLAFYAGSSGPAAI